MQASANFIIKFTNNYLKMWDRREGFERIIYLIEDLKVSEAHFLRHERPYRFATEL